VEEIAAQRDLIHAENNELPVRPVELRSGVLLSQVLETYESFARTRNCELVKCPQTEDIVFRSDQRIVTRVIGNMIKNALARSDAGGVSFSVHNTAYIPHKVRLQLFKRSFSTKGIDRGLGTYSMKLLTERYLEGRISFTSSEKDGTTFTLTLQN
jgi:signal transduction histidine kinase